MDQVSLRNLVQKYAKGEIGKDEYRTARSELIKNILARESTLCINEYPPLISPNDEATLDITQRGQKKEAPAPQKAQEPAAVQKQATVSYLKPLYIAGIVAVIIVAVIIVILVLPGPPKQQPVLQKDQEISVEKSREEVSISASAQALINDFLDIDAWDNASLDGFLQRWRELPNADRQSIKGTIELNELTNAIYGQLLEERAIAGLETGDNDIDTSSQENLIFFANQIGIDDPRFTIQVPDQTVAALDTVPSETVSPDVPEPIEVPLTETEPPAEQPVMGMDVVPEPAVTEPPQQVEVVEEPVQETTTAPVVVSQPEPEKTAVAQTQPVQPAPVVVQKTETAQQAEPEKAVPAPVKRSGNCDLSLLNSRRPYCRDIIPGIGNGPTMVIIAPGNFMMGGDKSEEQPRHNVAIENAFAMSVHEITYGEYLQFCRDTQKQCPAQPWTGNDYPVVNVSWHDATAYTEWLSEKTGQRYRLPSESQWEYAARGGTKTVYPFGDGIDISYAVFSERKSLSAPLPKTDRTINRNRFKLYHIVGNVREWVADTWNGDYTGAPVDGSARVDGDNSKRIVRGGSYRDTADALRSAARMALPADDSDNYTGFRVIQEL